MAERLYPNGVRILIDDEDLTKLIFGEETISLSDLENTWRNIDITPYVKYVGLHKIRITADEGVGRVDVKVKIR